MEDVNILRKLLERQYKSVRGSCILSYCEDVLVRRMTLPDHKKEVCMWWDLVGINSHTGIHFSSS